MTELQTPSLDNGLWQYDIVNDKYCFSPGICKIFNLNLQDLGSHADFLKLIHPDDIERYSTLFDANIKAARPFISSFRIVLKDETVKEIEENVDFTFDGDGIVTSYFGIVSDVSPFIKLQQERNNEYFLIHTLLKALPNLIFVKNIDTNYSFSFVNDNFATFYGFTPSEIIGKQDKDISTPEQAKSCYISDKLATKHKITSPLVTIEEIPITKRSVKFMQTIKFAHVINGTNYLICSAMDITDLVKARQKAEKSDRMKAAFLNSISHEIRTPMNSIMGFSELLCEAVDTSDMELFRDEIEGHCEQLLKLIENTVFLAGLETAEKEILSENIDIESMLSEIKEHFEGMATKKELDLVYTPHSGSCNIFSNRTGITKLMDCLIDNAIKFTEHGSVAVGYDLKDKCIRLWVKDTGIGIDKVNARKVFKRFFKIDEFSSGLGIGLFICQKIAKLMRGDIGLKSTKGKGTYVWVDLPLDADKQ
jgi:PAS domain S-box-containing protein